MKANPQIARLPVEKIERLGRFVGLLDRWRKITNLISDHSFREIWERHIEDSLRVQAVYPGATKWVDFGSGAGFPGLVIGEMIAHREGAHVHCVESDARKCAFLRAAVDDLQIPVSVHNVRAETISTLQTGAIDAITARAFSSVSSFLEISRGFLESGAIAVLPRGRTFAREIESLDAMRYEIEINKFQKGVIAVIRQKAASTDG